MEVKLVESNSLGLSKRKRALKSLVSILCGFENFDDSESKEIAIQKQNQIESKRRVDNFYSLNQSKFERDILIINLVFILCIAIGLYFFFSIPPQYHIFKHINLKQFNTTNYQ